MEDQSFNALYSDRLVVRRFRDADAEYFAAYRSDPNVARYQGWDSYSVDEARRFITSLDGVAPGTPDCGFQFAVALAPAGPLIGDCFLSCRPDDPRQAELGFTFASAFQHQGYAFEAVASVLEYAFTVLDLHRIFAITDARNGPAQRLLDRLDFRLEGRFSRSVWFKGDLTSEWLYAQLQDEWRRTRRATPRG